MTMALPSNLELRAELDAAAEAGLVRKVSKDGLTLYNYTDKCTFERAWTPALRAARGLIFDEQSWFVAQPFPKFFNLHEADCPALPLEHGYEVQEKIDGSLGIWFWWEGRWRCATRGSLDNQFITYAETHANLLVHMPKNWTVLTEIVMPEKDDGLRRAVAHAPGLYLLGARERTLGHDYSHADFPVEWGGHHITRVTGVSITDLQNHAAALCDREGWVLRFNDPLATRVKIKTAWYVRVARALTGLSAPKVADLEAEDSTGQWLVAFPEELRKEAEDLRFKVQCRMIERVLEIAEACDIAREATATRAEFAHRIKDLPDKPYLFAQLDGKHELIRERLLRKDTWVRCEKEAASG